MKRILYYRSIYSIALLGIFFSSYSLYAQEKTLQHKYYTVTFSVQEHIPILVKYVLRKDMVTCSEARAGWKEDPLLPGTNFENDYAGTPYDRGHNMPHKDNACDKDGIKECFYYTNCFPQTKKLNRGVWKALENYERDYAEKYGKIKVFIGHIDRKKERLGAKKITIPAYCWKVIFVNKKFEAYIFPNTEDVVGNPEDFTKPSYLDKIQKDCKLNFAKLVTGLKN